MIKIHDIILFAISMFFMVILISNYITNYTNETKLIEANDLDYYRDLVAELGNVDADNNIDIESIGNTTIIPNSVIKKIVKI